MGEEKDPHEYVFALIKVLLTEFVGLRRLLDLEALSILIVAHVDFGVSIAGGLDGRDYLVARSCGGEVMVKLAG